jgi:hypothetical protein
VSRYWRVVETMRDGEPLDELDPRERVWAEGEDYMVLLEQVRRRRVTRFTHYLTSETRDLTDFEVVPAIWNDPELFHWMNKATAQPWCWAVIVRAQDWPPLLAAHEARKAGQDA